MASVRFEQLSAFLAEPLPPIVVLSGDEPLQMKEAADAVRAAAREQQYLSRTVLDVEAHFDWSELGSAAGNLSLFAERKLLELRLPSGKPGRDGGKALKNYASQAPDDTLLLLSLPRMDRSAQNSAWFKALSAVAAVVSIWPVETARLPAWIKQRLASVGLSADREGIERLAERTEGNLLACAQEIDKLLLLNGPGRLQLTDIDAAVADSARYEVFALSTVLLSGRSERAGRIVQRLRSEGAELPFLIGIIARDLRILARLSGDEPAAKVFKEMNVWRARQGAYQQAVTRLPPRAWRALLARAATLDKAAKGRAPEVEPWRALWLLLLLGCGARLPTVLLRA